MNYNSVTTVSETDGEGSFAGPVDRLIYEFAGVDRAFVTAEFAANARRIAREDASLVEEIIVDLYAHVSDYEISGLHAESITAIRSACVLGVQYSSARIESIAPCQHGNHWASCSCRVAGLTLSFVGNNKMYVTPAPTADALAGAVLRVATSPTEGRCTYPAEFIAHYEDVLLHAVRARLYGMRSAPWYSRGESERSGTISARGQISKRADALVGVTRGVVRLEKRRVL